MPALAAVALALAAVTTHGVVAPPADAAVVRSSGSTNAPGFTLAVRPSGSATVASGGTTTRTIVDPARVTRLFAALRTAGNVAGAGSEHCMRSVSFGSTLTVAWHGETSRDLSCGRPEGGGDAELRAAVAAIVAHLDLARPGGRRFPL